MEDLQPRGPIVSIDLPPNVMSGARQSAFKGLSIRELPRGERPRERLKAHGAHALSSAELLAIVLGTGQQGAVGAGAGARGAGLGGRLAAANCRCSRWRR